MTTELPTGDDPRVYIVHKSVSAWRWEFLRRRDDYRDDWSRVHANWLRQRLAECGSMPLPEGVESWEAHYRDMAELPNYAHREKYAVTHLVNPSREWNPTRFLTVFLSRAEQIWDRARRDAVPPHLRGYEHRFEAFYLNYWARQEALEKAHIVTTHIDLQQPIEPQIDFIRKWTKEVQRQLSPRVAVTQRRGRQWAMYLQMLDLNRRGHDLAAIASRVYPDKSNSWPDYPMTKKVRAALKQARHLQDTLALGR